MSRQTIYVLGYPKSGTTWLARLLGDALNSPVGALLPANDGLAIATEGQDRLGKYHVRQGHAVPIEDHAFDIIPDLNHLAYKNLTDERIIVMVRDPRDVAISVQHHWGLESLKKAVQCMVEGIWPLPHGGGWVKWVESWHTVGETVDITWTSYESLRSTPYIELGRVLDALQVDVPPLWHSAVEHQSFASRRQWTELHGDSLNYGKEFQLRFLRKGAVGDWRNHDWDGCYDWAMDAWGEMMGVLGYE